MKRMFRRQIIVSISAAVIVSAQVIQWPPLGGVQLSAFEPGTEGILRGADSVAVLGKWSNDTGMPLSLWTVNSRIMRENLFSIMAMNQGGVAGYFSGPPLHSAWMGGFLHNLAPIWEREGWINDMSAGLRNTCGMPGDDSGALFCVPFETYIWAMFYRESHWDAMGLPAKKPETFDEMMAVCETVKSVHNKPCIALGTEHVWYVGAWIDYLSMRMYGPAFHQNFTSGKADFQGPECRAIFAQFQDLFIKGYFNTDSRDRFWDEAADLFLNGEAAMMLIADWFKGNLINGHWESLKDEPWLDVYKDINFFRFPKIADVPIGEDMPTDALMMGYADTQEIADNGESLLAYLMGDDYQKSIMYMIQVPARISIQQVKNSDLEKAGHMFQKMMAFIDESDVVLQFFDRDLNREMVAIGWEGFRILLADPLNPDSLEQMLALMEAGRKEIYVGQVTDPVIHPESGTYEAPLNVTATCLARGVTIRYSRDPGIWPQESSPEIPDEGLILEYGEHVVRIFAGKKGVKPSLVVEARYTVTDSSRVEPCDIGWFRGAGGGDCQACSPGTAVASEGATECVPCATGEFNSGQGRSACDKCPRGTYGPTTQAVEVSACLPCIAGKFLNNTGSYQQSQCQDCAAGSSTTGFRGQALCTHCETGKSTEDTGQSECNLCKVGTYSDTLGKTACTSCGDGKDSKSLWATMKNVGTADLPDWARTDGAKNVSLCGCDTGTRLQASSGECVTCSEGMECVGMDKGLISPGFYASDIESVYRCHADPNRCPGGLPGETCAVGRDGIVCALCQTDMTPAEGGSCEECGGKDLAPFFIVAICALLGTIAMYHMIDTQDRVMQSRGMLACTLAVSQLVGVIQQLGVIRLMSLEWVDPILSLMSALSLFAFDVEFLRLNCLGGDVGPVGRFIIQNFIILVFLVLVCIIHVLFVVIRYRGDFAARFPSLIGMAGTVCTVCYISILSTSLRPLQCHSHPNDARTMTTYGSVTCWEGGDHTAMVIIMVFSLAIPLGYMLKVAHVVWSVPKMLAQANVSFLRGYSFLFARFTPQCYWFILVFICRSALISMSPVFPNTMIQVFVLQVTSLAALVATILYMPWRIQMANYMDCAFNTMILFFVIFANFLVDPEDMDTKAVGWVLLIGVLFCVALVPLTIIYRIAMIFVPPKKQYQYFLCHHKAGAGAFTRMMKMHLSDSKSCSREVFVDSDNLFNLDSLYGYVANDTETLVVLASKEIFTRVWCAGEITTARLWKVPTLLVQLPDCEMPSDILISNYSIMVANLECLTENCITIEMVQETMQWVKDLPKFVAVGFVNAKIMDDLCSRIIKNTPGVMEGEAGNGSSAMGAKPTNAGGGSTQWILADHLNNEAVASGFILKRMLVPHTAHDEKLIPMMIEKGMDIPPGTKTAITICTNGSFEERDFCNMLLKAARDGQWLFPVIAEKTFRFLTQEQMANRAQILFTQNNAGDPDPGIFELCVTDMFKEIAATFMPNMAADSTLQQNAKEIFVRLKTGLLQTRANYEGRSTQRANGSDLDQANSKIFEMSLKSFHEDL